MKEKEKEESEVVDLVQKLEGKLFNKETLVLP